jgi:holo-[acyl-carrier protein] synthase
VSILGIGHDLVELDRIRQTLSRHGEKFLHRCFTDEELSYCQAAQDPIPSLAVRFAAKEAGVKALGTGIAGGIAWREIEVRREPGQPPTLHFQGRAADRARSLGMTRVHLTLTHSRDYGAAVVIIEGA